MTDTRLGLTRPQILALRRHAGALDERLSSGEGSLRRADTVLTVWPWRRLSPAERDAVTAEAQSLPQRGTGRPITVRWEL